MFRVLCLQAVDFWLIGSIETNYRTEHGAFFVYESPDIMSELQDKLERDEVNLDEYHARWGKSDGRKRTSSPRYLRPDA